MMPQGTHMVRCSQQSCWTLDSFESIPKSQTPSTSDNNIAGERTYSCSPVRMFQMVCLLKHELKNITQLYKDSQGNTRPPFRYTWACGHFYCGRPSHPLLLLIWKVPRRKEAPEIGMCSLQWPHSGQGWSLHLELSQQLSGSQIRVPGNLASSCLTLLYLALYLKWPSIKNPSLIKNQSLRLSWPKIRSFSYYNIRLFA